MRKIIHIDMDAFFASIEQRDFPEYRNKPLVVGGQPNSRGVVATCSYEARQFGIHSAMPSAHAYRLCPSAIFVPPRFEAYRQASDHIRAIFKRYTSVIEPLSLDEAFLDVTNARLHHGSATLIAAAIRADIKQELKVTASAGISYNKFLAKLASDENKPDGQFTILADQASDWLRALPIRKFFGIGKATEAKMHRLGIYTGKDLETHSKIKLIQAFGHAGAYYYDIVRGIDDRPVSPSRKRQSIGCENTYAQDISSTEEMLEALTKMTEKIATSLVEKSLYAQTLTIKATYPSFQTVTRSHTFPVPFNDSATMVEWLPTLLKKTDAEKNHVRLLGISVSKLSQMTKVLL